MNLLSFSVRRPALAVVAVLTASLTLAWAGGGARAAATTVHCPGTITAGHRSGIMLRGYAVTAHAVGCTRARTVVSDFLQRKLRQASERCAGRAENPPYRGCVVDGYRCRASGRVRTVHGQEVTQELCTEGSRAVRYSEVDSTHA